MDTLLKQFDSFLKRSMLPSSVLVLILILFAYKDNSLKDFFIGYINIINDNYFLIFMTFILFIAISFIMKVLTQIFFDNMLKRDFNSIFLYFHENEILMILRKKSIEKLQKENTEFDEIELTDFFLYQVLGRKLQFLEHKTDTKRYIDDTKSAGSIFIAIIIALLIQIILNFGLLYCLIGILLILATYFLAIEYIKSKYRSRAIRIYTNYLIGDNQ